MVKKGESLSKLAKRYYGSMNKWPKLYALNKSRIKNPDLVRPGTKILVPTN